MNARFTDACNENHKIILDARKLNEQLNQATNSRTVLEREVQQQMQQMQMAHGADQANWERNMQVMRNNVQLLTQRNQQLNNILAHFQRQTGSPLSALDLSIADGGSVYNPDVNMIGHPSTTSEAGTCDVTNPVYAASSVHFAQLPNAYSNRQQFANASSFGQSQVQSQFGTGSSQPTDAFNPIQFTTLQMHQANQVPSANSESNHSEVIQPVLHAQAQQQVNQPQPNQNVQVGNSAVPTPQMLNSLVQSAFQPPNTPHVVHPTPYTFLQNT